jgi:exonuclease VII small subunit
MNAEKQIKVNIKMLSMNAHVSTLLRQCQKSLDLAKSRIRKLLVSKGVK